MEKQISEQKQYELDNPECPRCGLRGYYTPNRPCDACGLEGPTIFSWMAQW